MKICIFGASSEELNPIYFEETEKLGEAIALHNHGIVFGGGATGLMGACARGAHKYNAEIVGIAPDFFDQPGILYQECTEFIFTKTMRERKQLMEDRSDAIIVLPGGIGTYEEFLEIYTLKSLGKLDRPIVIYNINHYYDMLLELLQKTANENFMGRENLDLVYMTDCPGDALSFIENYIAP